MTPPASVLCDSAAACAFSDHRIADAFGDRGRLVGRAGEIAVGHADAGGGEHLLAEPFRLRALAELGQALDRLGLSPVARARQQRP